jgi:NitT/TauT family transport system substrate-binding protein
MKDKLRPSRRTFVHGLGVATLLGSVQCVSAATSAKLEKPKLTVGLATEAASAWPVYMGAARSWAEQGIDGTLIAFQGDSAASQALAGDSIDISLQSPDGLINLLNSNQPVIAFYAGFSQSDYAWYAQPQIKSWDDLKGKQMGISTFGSQTEQLTTYVLARHGLVAGKDVNLLQVGPPTTGGYQALKSGRVAANIQSPPTKWMAGEGGFTLLGTQATEVAPQWPKHVIVAKKKFIEDNPETVKAFLRAHVSALRLMRADRTAAVKVLADRLKYDLPYVEKAYDEVMPGFDEQGNLPDMKVYWDIQMKSGVVTEPWPDSKLLDDRFIKSFASWAP